MDYTVLLESGESLGRPFDMSVSSRPFPFSPPGAPAVEIVELTTLDAEHLESLWAEEQGFWKELLYWDSEPATALVRAAVRQRRLPGKVILAEGKAVGCAYYLIDGSRAVLGSFTLAERARTPAMVATLAKGLLGAVQSKPGVRRIETQFVPCAISSLRDAFLATGFREFERVFLRGDLTMSRGAPTDHRDLQFVPWASSHAHRAAELMHQAHRGSVDADMNELYRTPEGCRGLLDSIIVQHGCGKLVPTASYVLREPRSPSLAGFLLTTEISTGHAHLAQVAVSPSAQGHGLGKLLLGRAIEALAKAGYRSVSLMVSETNERALALYASMGFRAILEFPVFSWDRLPLGSR